MPFRPVSSVLTLDFWYGGGADIIRLLLARSCNRYMVGIPYGGGLEGEREPLMASFLLEIFWIEMARELCYRAPWRRSSADVAEDVRSLLEGDWLSVTDGLCVG